MYIRPASAAPRNQTISRPFPFPAPVGGLNALDSIADMPAQDALQLDNFFPQPDYVELRRGYAAHVTGLGAAISSLMEWSGPTGRQLFAAVADKIYDVTSSGAVGAAEISSLTNGKWQHVMQETSGGNFLMIANGADAIRTYDGTSWATPSITGATSADIIGLASHKERIWLVEKDSANAWYLGTEAVSGAATKFPLGSIFKRGGQLLAIGSMSRDGGAGPDDFCCFISDTGEVAIYQGTDPASASTWAIVGVFEIPPPIGRRCVTKTGADLAIITEGGVISLSVMLALDRAAAQRAAVTSKINRIFNSDARAYRTAHGWQVLTYPRNNMFLINVPESEGVRQVQYVMNALTGAWCRFTGLNAGCWSLLNEDLYFGGNDGTVYQADTGFQDAGGGITADLKTAFNDLGRPGVTKNVQMMRTLFSSNGTPGFLMEINTDYADSIPTDSPTAGPAPTTVWGAATWSGSNWVAGNVLSQNWVGTAGIGHDIAIRLRVVSDGASCTVNAFDVISQTGGLV